MYRLVLSLSNIAVDVFRNNRVWQKLSYYASHDKMDKYEFARWNKRPNFEYSRKLLPYPKSRMSVVLLISKCQR